MGGQKGIALFNTYISKYVNLTCITVQSNNPALAEGYTVDNCLSNSPLRYLNITYFFTVRRILKKKGIRHVVLEHPYYGWLGLLLKWFCGVKLIVHSHNIEFLRFKSTGKWWWWILKWYEKLVYRKADFVFFITGEDRNYALQMLKVHPERCAVATYGFELEVPPLPAEKKTAREQLCATHKISADATIMLFNGTLSYGPNLDALQVILDVVNPMLLQSALQYKIIICGKGLPDAYNNLQQYSTKNITFAGFVDDVSTYFKGSSIFLNPLIDGGGIKTKLVEALGYGMDAVSTRSGAIGVPEKICNNKLLVTEDGDWDGFCRHILAASKSSHPITRDFFTHFYWGNIAKGAAERIAGL
jgi:polysaccharide biosynthesis protein PslH